MQADEVRAVALEGCAERRAECLPCRYPFPGNGLPLEGCLRRYLVLRGILLYGPARTLRKAARDIWHAAKAALKLLEPAFTARSEQTE